TLNFIHLHKTAALLEACVVSGGLLGGAGEDTLAELSGYAKDIGLAFQIVDDILDITATQQELGKSVGKDIDAQKATYPSLVGLQESRDRAQELLTQSKTRLEPFGENAKPLQAIADYIVARTY
ncbi:MAG: polyprenyl synthetase family protein, partial [Cyanophyceae cyanobacterium]